jgi:hypothetical protein
MSTSSDNILITDNRTSSSTTLINNMKSNEHHNEGHSIKNTLLDMIKKIILEFSTSDKSELREINRISINITTKLNHHYQNNLEYRNHRIMQRLLQLETINDDCYQCIGELWSELYTLCNVTHVLAEYDNNASRIKNDDNSVEGLRKGFLLEKKVNDRRKKLYKDNELVDSSDYTDVSNSSNNLNYKPFEPFRLYEYDSNSYINETIRNDKEYIIDDDYGFE